MRIRETTWVANRECPPSAKKLSRTPTRSSLQHCGPDCCDHLLDGCAGSEVALPVLGVALSGTGRAARSSLPLGISGSESSATMAARDHVLRQVALQKATKLRRVHRHAVGHNVGNQTYIAGRVRSRDHHSGTHGWMLFQYALDLPGLDPETSQLELLVQAAEEFERAIWAPTHSVSGAIQTLSRRGPTSGPKGSGTKRSAVKAAFPRYPRATPAPPR